jgi:hypothetical protein
MSDNDWRTGTDDEGFPVCNEDREGDLYTDEYGVTYACTLVDGLGWSWKHLGRAHEPPTER